MIIDKDLQNYCTYKICTTPPPRHTHNTLTEGRENFVDLKGAPGSNAMHSLPSAPPWCHWVMMSLHWGWSTATSPVWGWAFPSCEVPGGGESFMKFGGFPARGGNLGTLLSSLPSPNPSLPRHHLPNMKTRRWQPYQDNCGNWAPSSRNPGLQCLQNEILNCADESCLVFWFLMCFDI